MKLKDTNYERHDNNTNNLVNTNIIRNAYKIQIY